MDGSGPPSPPSLGHALGSPSGVGNGSARQRGTSSVGSRPISTQKDPLPNVLTSGKSRSNTPSAELKKGRKQLPRPKGSTKKARVIKRAFADVTSEYTAGDISSDVLSNVSQHPAKKSRTDSPEEQPKENPGDNLVCIRLSQTILRYSLAKQFCCLCEDPKIHPSIPQEDGLHFVTCGTDTCQIQVCVGPPARACFSIIDQQKSLQGLCESHQNGDQLNVRIINFSQSDELCLKLSTVFKEQNTELLLVQSHPAASLSGN